VGKVAAAGLIAAVPAARIQGPIAGDAGMPYTSDADRLAPVHPGEILLEEFMAPHGLGARALALRIGVPANRVSAIVAGRRGVTGDTALRLAKAFGTTPGFWLNLQKGWELETARDAVGPALDAIEPLAV
jgi:addiction module HigA family antidote